MLCKPNAEKTPCVYCGGRGQIDREISPLDPMGQAVKQLFGSRTVEIQTCPKCGGAGKTDSNAGVIFTADDLETIREALTQSREDYRHLTECKNCRRNLSDVEFAECVRKRDAAQAALDAMALAIEKGKL